MPVDAAEIKRDYLAILRFLPQFLLKPVENMRALPSYHPVSLVAFQLSLSVVSGLVMGLIGHGILLALVGALVMLVAGLVTPLLTALAIYYFFYLFYSTQLAPLELFKVVIFANIPFLIFHVLAAIFPPIDLLGLALACLLLIVGLTDSLQLPRKLSVKLVVVLYLLIAVSTLIF